MEDARNVLFDGIKKNDRYDIYCNSMYVRDKLTANSNKGYREHYCAYCNKNAGFKMAGGSNYE